MQLIKEGADPNAGYGCALTASADRGQLQMVNLLLDRGANPNLKVSGDLSVIMGSTTPLEAAVLSRDVRMVRLLLERGANPRNDIDAFQVVLNFGDVEMAELLLHHGANANMTYPAEMPVYYFVEIRPREMRQAVVPRRDLEPDRIDETVKRLQCNVSTFGGTSLLHLAVEAGGPPGGREGRERIARLLITRGADPNSRTLNGSTPLMLAARQDMRRVIVMLKDAGADVKATDRCGRTAADRARSLDTKALLTDK
jgi:ankyrin repeat protein